MHDTLHQVMATVDVPTGAATPAPDGTPQRGTTTIVWGPCIFQPISSSEDRAGKHTVVTEHFISGPLDQRIVEGSSITANGQKYPVKGKPKHFTSGVLDHTEATLLDSTG